MPLSGKTIVLGISGSIASYKAADLASRLTQAGAQVDAVMTPSATRFITPLAIRSLTRRRVYVDMFDPESELAEEHVELARRADAVVVAPASATTIARIANGLAEDMVSLTVLATTAPVLVAPAMDSQMYQNPATQANVALLRQRGVTIVGPVEGRLASGRVGTGRMESPENIVGAVRQALGRQRGDLAGRRLVVSAGGTREPMDPVRFISNYSSGKMGYALAEAARDRGADVTLVSTVAALPVPYGVRLARAETVAQMREAVLTACEDADALIMAAAVSDYRPARRAEQKIKKGEAGEGLVLELAKNPDFLLEVPDRVVKVGFAAETENLLENAREKLRRKRLDLIVANDVTATDAGFGTDTNRVVIVDPEGGADALPLMTKYEVSLRILDRVAELLRGRA